MEVTSLELREQVLYWKEQASHYKQQYIEVKEENRYYRELESLETDKLATALAKAQSEFKIAGKSRDNPFFKSTYADYEDLVAATREALTKHGLSIQTRIITRNDRQYARVIMRHASGQFTTSESLLNPVKNDPQSEGSCRSYKHRYGYREITGVVVSEDTDDDDGEAAVSRGASQQAPLANNPLFVTKEQVEMIEQELKGDNDLKYDMLEKLKIDTLFKLPKTSFTGVLNRIREIKSLRQ